MGVHAKPFDSLIFPVKEDKKDVNGKMSARVAPRKTASKAIQVTGQLRLQSTNLGGIHAKSSLSSMQMNQDKKFANLANLSNTNLAL